MGRSVEENMETLLNFLVQKQKEGKEWISGVELQELTGLSPDDINNAITILLEQGLVEWLRYLGTAPFVFGQVTVTPRGLFEFERKKRAQLAPIPVGSPFGFTQEDWAAVTEAKSKSDELRVVLGCQLESGHYDTTQLERNIKQMFDGAVQEYNQMPNAIKVKLDFRLLAAGYGEHLFNEIARDIISADIAVFDTSDLNPNVMLEMGVALTWDIMVLPIKEKGCPKPPSDISGQTWADYLDSAKEFEDKYHHRKLIRMVERAVRKKSSKIRGS